MPAQSNQMQQEANSSKFTCPRNLYGIATILSKSLQPVLHSSGFLIWNKVSSLGVVPFLQFSNTKESWVCWTLSRTISNLISTLTLTAMLKARFTLTMVIHWSTSKVNSWLWTSTMKLSQFGSRRLQTLFMSRLPLNSSLMSVSKAWLKAPKRLSTCLTYKTFKLSNSVTVFWRFGD